MAESCRKNLDYINKLYTNVVKYSILSEIKIKLCSDSILNNIK